MDEKETRPDACEVFGMDVSNEMKELPPDLRRKAKIEIQNILNKYSIQHLTGHVSPATDHISPQHLSRNHSHMGSYGTQGTSFDNRLNSSQPLFDSPTVYNVDMF